MKKNKDGFAFPAYGSGNRAGADGSKVKEKRFRYSCHYNVRHPSQCDGQSGYGVTKLDAIVESIVCTKFSEILECSKSKLLQDMLRKDMEVAQKEVSRAKSELDLKENACTFYIWHQVYRLTRVRIHDKLYIVSCGLKGDSTMSSILVEKWKGKPYRLVIQRQRRIDGDLDIWEGEYTYRCILTNDYKST